MYILESIGIDATHTALGIEDKGYTDRREMNGKGIIRRAVEIDNRRLL